MENAAIQNNPFKTIRSQTGQYVGSNGHNPLFLYPITRVSLEWDEHEDIPNFLADNHKT
jgi:hypothetical protein